MSFDELLCPSSSEITGAHCEHSGDAPSAGTAAQHILVVAQVRGERDVEIIKGIAHYRQEHGCWRVTLDDAVRPCSDWREVLACGYAGVISLETCQALVEACAERAVPLVDLGETPVFAGVSRVRSDDAAIGVMGAEHFLEQGFRNFGFVGWAEHGWSRERECGFVEAVRLAGHGCATFALNRSGEWLSGRGRCELKTLAAWLREQPKPLAVMASDDRRALATLEAAQRAGCEVPEEVAVLGAGNDVGRCELAVPTLSSVAPGAFNAGYLAADQLARRMKHPGTCLCDLRVEPAKVVARRSTDGLAIPDRAVAQAVRFIAENACRGLTVAEVLPHAAVSRAQLERKFRQFLGRSPQAEIRRVQVASIRKYLAETDLPLKRIAELAGFDYLEHMCVVFRRLTGEAPGAYRRRSRPRRIPEPGLGTEPRPGSSPDSVSRNKDP